ncbi:hypothetical protein CRE_12388 [Caenorhabditis remanei]|uniref:Uncharacterized protein n=1 Tax=Caenorhabditis remanei TaxID=31234 RepID=E3NMK4_CAERE|nr:hypothetical protein CRE_12388 [Caenorhabditis remanei]
MYNHGYVVESRGNNYSNRVYLKAHGQQSPHWIVQVSREPYVWKATLLLFVHLRDFFRPTTVHFDPGDLRYVLKNVKGVRIDATGGLVASDELMSWKADFFHDIKDHDDGLAWDKTRRTQHIRYTDPRSGRYYIRTDGTIATVVKWNANGS